MLKCYTYDKYSTFFLWGDSMAKNPYYSYTKIDKIKATYNLIIGQRSNGKTYGACRKALETYLKTGKPSVYVRRMEEMIRPMNIEGLFNPHIEYIKEATENKYNSVVYRLHKFYLARYDEDDKGRFIKTAQDMKPFCLAYAISTAETTKGTDPGEVAAVYFDEFITRQFYLANEFIKFQNLLSSIIRDRPNVKIYMLANTVSKHCPYFRDMGLYRIQQQEQGTIDVYELGKSGTKIAVEYCSPSKATQKVSKYFCFDNPQLDMITKGSWEIAMYRHAPESLSKYKIFFSFFVIFDGKTVQGDIYNYIGYPLIFFHPKTTPIKNPESTVIYSEDQSDGNPLHQMDLRVAPTRAQKLIFDLCRNRKTFFADNETGEIIASWAKFAMNAAAKVAI